MLRMIVEKDLVVALCNNMNGRVQCETCQKNLRYLLFPPILILKKSNGKSGLDAA